jgi:hypothetical protein
MNSSRFSGTLTLNPSQSAYDVNISNKLAPYELTINTRYSIPVNSRVYRIEYNFDDGSEPLIQKLRPVFAQTDRNLAISQQIGDPRNYPVTKKFYLQEELSKTFNITVKVFWVQSKNLQNLNYITYKINLNLSAPSLDSETVNNYFSDLQLASTRMFGLDNSILYNFESSDPDCLLPVLVKWKKTKPTIPSVFTQNVPTFRPYKILPPFLNINPE